MSDKNHEQYLEQIETAVAEITTEILDKHSGDLRAMAKVCAEKQVEINRLKEHQSDDRSTIRNLRAHFKEAVDEATELKLRLGGAGRRVTELKDEIEELKEIDHQLYSVRRDADLCDITGLEDISELEDFVANAKELKKENEELKDEIECRNSTSESTEGFLEVEIEELKDDVKTLENTREAVRKALSVEPDPTADTLVKKIEELYKAACECRRMADNYDYLSLCNDQRKEEIVKLKGEAAVRFAVWQDEQEQIEKLKSQITKLQASEARLDQSTAGSMMSSTLAYLS